jgi:3-oxoacyl-[acyl-carrier-protein] synthase III
MLGLGGIMIHTPTIIESLGVYLPPKSVCSAEILKGCTHKIRIPFEFLTGVHSRRVAGETEFSIDLAEKAIVDCLMHSRYTAADIDVLISANISRYDASNFQCFYEPSTAVRLKRRLGFSNALVFDMNCACAGMFAAIHIIEVMIRAGLVKRGMVVSGEYITHLTKTAQNEIESHLDERLACLTLGDAGAAVILEAAQSDNVGFAALEMFTLGEYSSYCVAKPTDQPHGGVIMHTDMVNLTALGVKYTVSHCVNIMRRYGWQPGEIRHVLVHQTSKRSIDATSREFQRLLGRATWSRMNMINNLAERGNTASTSHFVALGDSIRSGVIRDGDRVLFGVVASGLTVGAALYTFDDLPGRLSCLATHPVTARPSADTSTGRHFSRHGLRRVRIEALGTSCRADGEKPDSLALLVRAVQNCLRASSRSIDDIDLLIYSGVYRSEFIGEPAIATLLAGKLGFRRASEGVEHVFAFDVMNGALGFLSGCFSAAGMLEAQRYQRAMVVAAEIENNATFPSAELRGVRESASAVLLTTGEDGAQGFGGFLFRDFLSHVDSFSAHLAQRNGRTYMSFQRKAGLEDDYLKCIDVTFHELLEREGLSPNKLSAVLPPQISPVFVAALRRRLPVSPAAVIDTSLKDQDLFTSSLAFSLQELYRTRPPNPGDVAMMLAVATGIQTGAALYYF